MKLKNLICSASITAFTTTLQAQSYNSAFGVRLGYDNGLTLKKFFAPASAAEFILSASPRHFQLTGLYEYQQPVAGAPNPGLVSRYRCPPVVSTRTETIMMVPSCWVQM